MTGFVFFFLFQHLAGSLRNSGFVYFCLLFVILGISAFCPFFRNSRSCWLLFCLVSRFDGQSFKLLNHPTSDLFLLPAHTTTHLPPNHTLPPHNCTIPPFTQDLTPNPVLHMGGAHALGSHVGGGGRKTTRTRESQGGRGDNHTLHTALKKLLFNCVPQIFLSALFAQQPNR